MTFGQEHSRTKLPVRSATLAIFGACDRLFDTAPEVAVCQPGYQLVEMESGEIYRLHAESGTVALVTSDGLVELTYETPQLEIGRFYRKEDSGLGEPGYLKYLGEGQFEDSKFAILKSDKLDN